MYFMVYWRCEANVVDVRAFGDANEIVDWLRRQAKIEPVAIIGIYDKETKLGESEKDYEQFCKRFNRK